MRIWYDKSLKLENVKHLAKHTMIDHIGIEWLEIGDDFLSARMPVDHRTQQPYGFLHGGASCVLAETLGSAASHHIIDSSSFYTVGIEINANHIRSVMDGFVYGKCLPIHIGSTTHVWDIKITNEEGKLICISRLTVAVLKKKV